MFEYGIFIVLVPGSPQPNGWGQAALLSKAGSDGEGEVGTLQGFGWAWKFRFPQNKGLEKLTPY